MSPHRSTPAPEEARARARGVLRTLRRLYPDADCELTWRTPWQLLVATILSAQSTDARVNEVTPELFARWPEPADLAAADLEEIERRVRSTGFYRQKARRLREAARRIVDEFDGRVPSTLDELARLPGVARKTANVVLGTAFGRNEGVAVDTHVGRLAWRLGLTWSSRDPKQAERIEADLMALLPRSAWTFVAHALILHGRRVCLARRPRCGECALASLCPSADLGAPRS